MSDFRPPRVGLTETTPNSIFDGDAPSFSDEVAAHWRQSWVPQLYEQYLQGQYDIDPEFNPWDGMEEKYKPFIENMLLARSKEEQDAIKAQIDANLIDEQTIAQGEWGIIAGLVAGLADPVNLVPIPIARGVGFLRGAGRGAAATAALTAGTEVARIDASPTASYDEMLYSVGLSGLLGGAIGGGVGAFSPRGSGTMTRIRDEAALNRTIERMEREIAENDALPIRAADYNLDDIKMDPWPNDPADPYYKPVKLVDDDLGFAVKQGPDGARYAWDEGFQEWVEADGVNTPEAVRASDDVQAALGTPEPELRRTMYVDQAAIRRGYDTGLWREEIASVTDAAPDTVIRKPDDLVLFEQIKAITRNNRPRDPDVDPIDYERDISKSAVEELQARRINGGYGTVANSETATWLAKSLNFSVVRKAMDLFAGDNVAADFMLRIGGDYGFSIKANELGLNTPPSLLIRSQQHLFRYYKFKQDFDKAWVKYASGGDTTEGKQFLGQNMTGTRLQARQWFRSKTDENVITRQDFAEMAGRAVFDKSDFRIRGKEVPPEAREAAEAFTRLMQEYDDLGRRYGIFDDQQGAQRALNKAKKDLHFWDKKINEWLFQETRQAPLPVAYEIDGVWFSGSDLADLKRHILDEFGDDAFRLMEDLDETSMRYRYEDDDGVRYLDTSDVQEMHARMLSAGQQKRYRIWQEKRDLARIDADDAQARLKEVTDMPHEFKGSDGKPIPYFGRYYKTFDISEKREHFTRMIADWFRSKDGDPSGTARERAEKAVDHIVKGETDIIDNTDVAGKRVGASTRHTRRRMLTMPNNHVYVDPELGELNMADFIDTNVLGIGENYVRRMGAMIETSKMFGDPKMRSERARMRAHLMMQNADPDTIEDFMGKADLAHRAVIGTLRTSDPMRWDNRLARNLKNATILATMGRVMLTSVPEAIRPFMLNGFKNQFAATWTRYLDDLENIRPNVEFIKLASETLDMAMESVNARYLHDQVGEHIIGTGRFERWLQEAIPGYFKINGLTPWTVFLKEVTMFGAQHRVMDDAIKFASGQADDALINRMAALGVNKSDMELLARMPFERKEGGKLILPTIQNWEGVDGMLARQKLLDAIHAEARRSIVTPSIGDRSLFFNGVWEHKGKVLFESDLMTLPLQFLSYGIAAHNKILVSGLQGRDANVVGGMFMMVMGGIFSAYLKAPDNAWRNKDRDEILLEGFENSGIGGFWFGDINHSIERMSNNTVGLRPLFGMDPKFGKDVSIADRIDLAGPGPSTAFDLTRAFWDPELTPTNRAQIIRRAVPYNNVLWWSGIFRNMAQSAGEAFEE